LGVPSCAPYPTWPSQDTSVNGSGITGLLARTCPGAADGPAAPGSCSGADDHCTTATPCDPQSGIVCVAKACEGKFMTNSFISDTGACQPVFISKVSGLPVASCDITVQRLARQARQADKRLSGSGSAGRSRSLSSGGGVGGESAAQPTRLGAVLPGGSRLLPTPSLSADVNAGGEP
jgi:hypothetical protein